MESSCGPCLWDIKLKSFSLDWPFTLCVGSEPVRTVQKSLQVGRNKLLFVCCAEGVNICLSNGLVTILTQSVLCEHPCPTNKPQTLTRRHCLSVTGYCVSSLSDHLFTGSCKNEIYIQLFVRNISKRIIEMNKDVRIHLLF